VKSVSTKKQEPVSKLYAKALFELARDKGEVDRVYGDVGELAAVYNETPALRQALRSVTFSLEDRESLVKALCEKMGAHPLVARLTVLLASKGRSQLLPEIRDAFLTLLDESKNVVRGTVTTVEPLNDTETAGLSKAFGKKLDKQVVLDSVIDKEILGGLIVKVQGLTFDGSLKTTIRRLKETLERQSV
jgi:F-type H+-transporting ATPase subunit delta